MADKSAIARTVPDDPEQMRGVLVPAIEGGHALFFSNGERVFEVEADGEEVIMLLYEKSGPIVCEESMPLSDVLRIGYEFLRTGARP